MLKNYLKVAFRTLRRNKGYTLINVGGLAVGLAACLLIGLWVRHELSYDRFHEGADRTYRVMLDIDAIGADLTGPVSPAPMARTLAGAFPEVTEATRLNAPATVTVEAGDDRFVEEQYLQVDSSFFELFSFPLVRGAPGSVLDAPEAVVLTQSLASKYFGEADAVGKTLQIDGETRRVTGIARDAPSNSHIDFDLVAAQHLSGQQASLWAGNSFYTYFRLREGASIEAFEDELSALVERRVLPQIAEMTGTPQSEIFGEGARYTFTAQPLTDIHLRSHTDYEIQPNGSLTYVWVFSIVAAITLLIACFNFMNLATARATERATEVGMRKALGAQRRQLAAQFFGESLLVTAGASVGALLLARVALPLFNGVAGTDLTLGALLSGPALLSAAGLIVLVGGLAGSYPALVLSRFNPVAVLKGSDRRRTGGGAALRRSLVTAQFALSIALIAGMLVVQQQFSYIQEKQLGLEKERVVVLDRADALGDRQRAFLEEVRRQPGVQQASVGEELFGNRMSNAAFGPADASPSEATSFNYLEVGPQFVETLDIAVAAGRSFSPDRPGDETAVMLNEAAAEKLGWEDPVSKALQTSIGGASGEPLKVIGVVENFHYQSLRREVEPLLLLPNASQDLAYVRLAPGAPDEALDAVRAAWNEFVPGEPFHYAFLDRSYDAAHRSTKRAQQLFAAFAGLAILLACLGLFGLAAFAAERRRKEIAVRKTFGASTRQLVALLSKDFLKLVALGFAIATPVAWLAMQRWLEGFAYRIDLGPLVFVAAGALALVVALAATGAQALRAARANPADALRDE